MNKFERVFYFFLIAVQFSFIIFLKANQTKNIDAPAITNLQGRQLYSFSGINKEGEKKLIHFSAYSSDKYIFCIVSTGCHHCNEFESKLKEFTMNNKINENIQLILLMESIDHIDFDFPFPVLKIERDDLIQFGFKTPSIFAVNGQGNILYNHNGYYPGIFKKALEKINHKTIKASKL